MGFEIHEKAVEPAGIPEDEDRFFDNPPRLPNR